MNENNFNNMSYDSNNQQTPQVSTGVPEQPIQQPVQPQPMDLNISQQPAVEVVKKKSPIGIIIAVVVLVVAVGVGVALFLNKNNDSDNDNNNGNKVEEKKEEQKKETGFYILDYDYASLKDGGDGSSMRIAQGMAGLSEFYDIGELPDKFWTVEKISMDSVYANTFEEPNSRYLHSFVTSVDDYTIYNIDDKSTVKEAFEKGWYYINKVRVSNFSVDYDYHDGKAVFDAIIKGLGKPYTVIRYNKNNEDGEYRFENTIIIYNYGSSYLLLDYYESTNGEKVNIDLAGGYWVASKEMVQAMIKDNVGSNNLQSYKQEYWFKNKGDFELKD